MAYPSDLTLKAKLLPRNLRGVLPLSAAPEMEITTHSRAWAPQPPGNVAATRGVKWEVGYTYVATTDGTTQWSAEVVLQVEHTIPANTPVRTEFILTMGTFTPATAKVGGQIRARLKRITATGTAPATNPFATQLGIHVECDTLGSRTISAK